MSTTPEEIEFKESLRQRLSDYARTLDRATYLRELLSRLKTGSSLRAFDPEGTAQNVLDIPPDIAIPLAQAELDKAEAALANLKTAAQPLIAFNSDITATPIAP